MVSEKSLGFGFGKFGLGRKVSVSEKFGLGKKSRFRFRKIWYRKKCLGIGFGQNFGIVIQCWQVVNVTVVIAIVVVAIVVVVIVFIVSDVIVTTR